MRETPKVKEEIGVVTVKIELEMPVSGNMTVKQVRAMADTIAAKTGVKVKSVNIGAWRSNGVL